MPEDYWRTDIRRLRKDLEEAIRLALERRSGIGQMRAAADAERLETSRLMEKADEMLAQR
jgi:hypothetical protein